MPHLLIALGSLVVTASAVFGMTNAFAEAPSTPVIGNERAVFLGSTTVTATALPPR